MARVLEQLRTEKRIGQHKIGTHKTTECKLEGDRSKLESLKASLVDDVEKNES